MEVIGIVLVIVAIALLIVAYYKFKNVSRLEQQYKNKVATERKLLEADINKQKNNAIFYEKTIEQLKLQQESAQQALTISLTELKDLQAQTTSCKEELHSLDLIKKSINDAITANEFLKTQLAAELAKMQDELNSIKTQHKIATKRLAAESEGRILAYTEQDVIIHNTLAGLKTNYPMLVEPLSNVQWTFVWQPRFKDMTNDMIGIKEKTGIYRIWTNENGVERSYVGQARKIRERWSQHIKAMLGVTKDDNHKFYSSVTPLNAHFEVVEECEAAKLNEREHYWIDYYNCIEDGYNSKR